MMDFSFLICKIYEQTLIKPTELIDTFEISEIENLNLNADNYKHYIYFDKCILDLKILSEVYLFVYINILRLKMIILSTNYVWLVNYHID